MVKLLLRPCPCQAWHLQRATAWPPAQVQEEVAVATVEVRGITRTAEEAEAALEEEVAPALAADSILACQVGDGIGTVISVGKGMGDEADAGETYESRRAAIDES